jgi:hypothetical protein
MVKSVVTLPSRMSFHLRDLPKAQRLVADQLDKAGQRFCNLLQRAAGVADQNSRHASETAQKLSHQLRAAEARIAELEAELIAYQEKTPILPSRGSIASKRRLKSGGFSSRVTTAAVLQPRVNAEACL